MRKRFVYSNLLVIAYSFLLLFMFGMQSCMSPEEKNWIPKEAPIMTRWAQDVKPGKVWTEYPRPQMKRHNWKNLNGLWECAITPKEATVPDSMQGLIMVPYPVESALSGVMEKVGPDKKVWYKKGIQVQTKIKSQRILLNFEAVDWETSVWIDGNLVGTHNGGYDPFSFDISGLIKPGRRQELVVSVWDPTTAGYAPLGKQTNDPQGIWYTPSTGIWQTVWMEMVPESYIDSYEVIPDIDASKATIIVDVTNPDTRDRLEIDLISENNLIKTFEGSLDGTIELDIPHPKLWSPDDPYLYDIKIRIMRNNTHVDEVEGYFGMRKISIGKDDSGFTRILLNNQFVFQNGPLDQGFWPDGLNTPPTEEAMVYDILKIKEMGFNMLRKHVKVEPRRFYYHTDRLGILVWQDMPSMYYGYTSLENLQGKVEEAKKNFELELTQLVHDHFNHPSIIMWVPFNEGWGQYDTEKIVNMIKLMDGTRLVNNASGWTDKGVGDVLDIHHYPEPRSPEPQKDRAIVLGEFGGLGLYVPGHVWQEENWGYEKMGTVEDLLAKYEDFYQEVFRLRDEKGLSACVYTQTTDVETETNGLMTYDRDSIKMGVENIARAHLGGEFRQEY